MPYGFGFRGIDGKIDTIQFCRINKVPFLGICLGMQLAVIEYARNVLNLSQANSLEFDPGTKHPIFVIQDKKYSDRDLGGTLQLGNAEVIIQPNTLTHKLYKSASVHERYRNRYDFNNDYLTLFANSDMVFSAKNHLGAQAVIELKNHPFFIACQYHPEFSSKPMKPNVLFLGLLDAAKKREN